MRKQRNEEETENDIFEGTENDYCESVVMKKTNVTIKADLDGDDVTLACGDSDDCGVMAESAKINKSPF